ncbi:MAG: zinc ribbon domain-containing protein, partial [Candidatus Dormibacteria bacterium]
AAVEALDLRRVALEAEQAEAKRRLGRDPKVEGLRRRQAELESLTQHQASQLRQLELEVAELAQRAKSHEQAIFDGSVRHPADLQRRQHELETLRRRIGQLEEQELSQLEAQEETGKDLGQVAGELAADQGRLEELRRRDRDREGALSADLEEIAVERSRLLEAVTKAQLRTYELTAARQRPAVARVAGSTCSGCRLPLAPRVLHEARGEQLVTCENCQRILLL